MKKNKSEKIQIGLPNICAALLALGHEKLWIKDSGPQKQVITWDGFVAAQLNFASQSWEILPGANATFSNPEDKKPADATELTEEWIHQLTTVHP
ncbi:hypothetical protein FU190_22490 [Escherichia coli]|nr:hypothetical protein [Escherichia coli]EGN1958341.1 hypothetical protein [Salmonella enterica]EHD1641312.1 hypothetical protein [Salmonella enterica]EHU4170242.1 hypothetical protein [Escherichia coli]EIK8707785.1 hypothetical protein [Escherichia coli]